MSRSTIGLSEALTDYVRRVGMREHPELAALREATASHPMARMQIAPEQGALMQLLVRLMGARRCVEIGTFTGYSALAVALALPEDGRLVACDLSEEYTRIGRPFWERAGVAERIDLRIGPALDTLDALLAAGEAGRFDFAFVDADKESYVAYADRCLALLRPGGLLAVDNVLWSGRVVDPEDREPSTEGVRALNAHLAAHDGVDLAMVPVGDGLTLARKR